MEEQTARPQPSRVSMPDRRSLRNGYACGFTLMEMVATVIILGILAAIIVPRYLEFVNQTSASVARSVASDGLSRFKNAYAQYLLDTNTKPTTLDNLSGSAYLGLDGSGRVNTGDYDIVYLLNAGALTVTAYTKGDTNALANVSAAWP